MKDIAFPWSREPGTCIWNGANLLGMCGVLEVAHVLHTLGPWTVTQGGGGSPYPTAKIPKT